MWPGLRDEMLGLISVSSSTLDITEHCPLVLDNKQ